MEQLKITAPTDWGTMAWAAEQLGVSIRQVNRYIEAGTLEVFTPRCGTRETKRHKRVVSCEQVRELKRAREVVGRG
jgi:predicted site-specific integrase-resolvase